jgi:hypothetical protein
MLKTLWPLFTRILTVTLLLIYEGILTPTHSGPGRFCGPRGGSAAPLAEDPNTGHWFSLIVLQVIDFSIRYWK